MRGADLSFEVVSDARMLRPVRAAVAAYLESLGFPDERAQEAVLAVDEACANCIRHAYGGRPDAIYEVRLSADCDCVEVEVRDSGRPAPKEAVARRRLEPPQPDRLKPGGLGVQLIYEVFDEVEFHPGDQAGNRVLMRLKRPREGEEAG